MNTFVTWMLDEVSAEEPLNNLPDFGENHIYWMQTYIFLGAI